MLAAMLCALFAEQNAARADSMFELPRGRWTLRSMVPEMCFEVLPDLRVHLTFQESGDRNPVVLDGKYKVSATKMGDFHFSYTVDSIRTKTLSACRKYWVDEDLPTTKRLKTNIRPGQVLRFTAKFGCQKGKSAVQLCLHNGGEDGKQVICQDLFDEEKSCKEGPAIDGALINPPPTPLPPR